jgi:hypothetical protein
MVKAMNVYMPEHGKPIVKDADCPAEVVSKIVGAPYAVDNVTGSPRDLSNVYAAWVLKFARFPPIVYMISLGIGIMKKRKSMGIINALSVFRLNRISTVPMMNIGKESK